LLHDETKHAEADRVTQGRELFGVLFECSLHAYTSNFLEVECKGPAPFFFDDDDFSRPRGERCVFSSDLRENLMTSRPTFPLDGPHAFVGPELRPSDYVVALDAADRAELRTAIDRLAEHDRSGSVADAAALVPRFAEKTRIFRRELQYGRGFVLVRGVPVEGRTRDELARLYLLLGSLLGDAVPQNGQGDLLCDIRDVGADPTDPNVRLYTTRAEQDFHTDGADLIGLLSLRGAKSGGASRLVSSVSVVNAVARERPDLVGALFESFPFHLHGARTPGSPTHFRMPICRWDGAHLGTFFLGWYIRRALDLPDVEPLGDAQTEALEVFERTANDPALYLDMSLEPGDMQWLKNSVILHKRTAYEDHDEPELKRHLLRQWLAARDFDDGDERLRAGLGTRPEAKDDAERVSR
jgi:hypothetical protein